MKKIQKLSLTFIAATTFFMYACGPNDNKGSMDEKNSGGEGAVDSTKIPNFDSSHADSSHASLLSPKLIPSIAAYKTRTAFL